MLEPLDYAFALAEPFRTCPGVQLSVPYNQTIAYPQSNVNHADGSKNPNDDFSKHSIANEIKEMRHWLLSTNPHRLTRPMICKLHLPLDENQRHKRRLPATQPIPRRLQTRQYRRRFNVCSDCPCQHHCYRGLLDQSLTSRLSPPSSLTEQTCSHQDDHWYACCEKSENRDRVIFRPTHRRTCRTLSASKSLHVHHIRCESRFLPLFADSDLTNTAGV